LACFRRFLNAKGGVGTASAFVPPIVNHEPRPKNGCHPWEFGYTKRPVGSHDKSKYWQKANTIRYGRPRPCGPIMALT
jgi:hypothetical protein